MDPQNCGIELVWLSTSTEGHGYVSINAEWWTSGHVCHFFSPVGISSSAEREIIGLENTSAPSLQLDSFSSFPSAPTLELLPFSSFPSAPFLQLLPFSSIPLRFPPPAC